MALFLFKVNKENIFKNIFKKYANSHYELDFTKVNAIHENVRSNTFK